MAPAGLVTIAGAAGDVAADLLIFGATVDLSAGAGAVDLGAGAGAFFGFVFFFMMQSLDYPGYIQPHGLSDTIAIATPNSKKRLNSRNRHTFAILP